MAYILGGVTIPNPKKFTHNFIESAAQNELIFGITSKRITMRKRQYVLEYQNLTQAQIGTLESLYTPGTPISFQVTEDNLQLGPIQCFMDIMSRDFTQAGLDLIENMTIGLMEIVSS